MPSTKRDLAQVYLDKLFEKYRTDKSISVTEQVLCDKISQHETKSIQLTKELTNIQQQRQALAVRHEQLQTQLTQQTAAGQALIETLKSLWEATESKKEEQPISKPKGSPTHKCSKKEKFDLPNLKETNS